MTQKITVALEDDLDGGPADQTVRFGLDGAEYEIDLSTSNATAFRERLAPFTQSAHKAGRAPRSRPGRSTADRERSGGIRAWARSQGIAVSDGGRIPASVIEQYQAAAKGLDRAKIMSSSGLTGPRSEPPRRVGGLHLLRGRWSGGTSIEPVSPGVA
jgi:hypothetical protein